MANMSRKLKLCAGHRRRMRPSSMTFDAEAARIGKAVSYMTCKPEN